MKFKTAIQAIESMTAADKSKPTDFQVRALNAAAVEFARDAAESGEPTYPESIRDNLDDQYGIKYCWMTDETWESIDKFRCGDC